MIVNVLNIFMEQGFLACNKNDFEPYNVLLAIATNIPVLLMSVLQRHIFICSSNADCLILLIEQATEITINVVEVILY